MTISLIFGIEIFLFCIIFAQEEGNFEILGKRRRAAAPHICL
jgi:hypothetical protein